MKEATDLGTNRTGIATAPDQAEEMVAAALLGTPEADPEVDALGPVRSGYAAAADPLGSMPLPSSLKGAVKAVTTALSGRGPNVFLDKLSERLAFERTGTRLYQAAVSKVEAFGSQPGEPQRAELEEILREEHEHMLLVASAIRQLGGDPTLQSPSADMAAVASSGLLQVVSDPRTRVGECLQALLQAELVDNDAWTMLAELAEGMGEHDLAARFREALLHEERHLAQVRQWVTAAVQRKALGEIAEPEPDVVGDPPVRPGALEEQARGTALEAPPAPAGEASDAGGVDDIESDEKPVRSTSRRSPAARKSKAPARSKSSKARSS